MSKSMELSGKNALVTGGARGIGRAIVRALARRGCRVFVVDVRAEGLEKTVAELARDGFHVTPSVCDLANLDSATKTVDDIQRETGGVDILVNNAGGSSTGPLVALGRESIERTIAVNLVAPMELSRRVLPQMMRRRSGYVVNIGSQSSLVPLAFMTSYITSKAAVEAFSRCLRQEVYGTGVRILLVMPGPNLSEGYQETSLELMPRGGATVTPQPPERLAEELCEAIRREREVLHSPPFEWTVRIATLLAPQWLAQRLAREQHERARERNVSLTEGSERQDTPGKHPVSSAHELPDKT